MNKVLSRSTLDRSNLHTLTDLLPLRNAPALSFSHSASATLHRFASLRVLSKSIRPSIRSVCSKASLPLPPYLTYMYRSSASLFYVARKKSQDYYTR